MRDAQPVLHPLADLEIRQSELLRQIEELDRRVEATLAEVLRLHTAESKAAAA